MTQLVTVSGTVYDITKKIPVESVSVISTSGKGTITDSMGRYSIAVHENDSLYFSYLNKPTGKYAVLKIANIEGFDISIFRKMQDLPGVIVKTRIYRQDSIQNRMDYAKVFNFQKPGIQSSLNNSPGGLSVGIDLDELINMFRFRRNRSMLAFQNRLLQEEQDKYVDHRFSKGFVKKLTGLTSPVLDSFMTEYRPSYNMTMLLNDLELGQFIIEAYKYFQQGIKVNREYLRLFE